MSFGRRGVLVVVGVAVGFAGLIAAGAFAREELRKTFLRTILFTTADPDVLGEFSSTSMEPMTVTLQVRRPETIMTDGGQRATGRMLDRSLVFEAPAAYFYQVYLKEGPTGPQDVGFSVWSKRFDPALPDVIESQKTLRVGSKADRASTPVERRASTTGEYELRLLVINNLNRHPEGRQRNLQVAARGEERWPCEKGFDEALQMVTFRAPESRAAGQLSCLSHWHGNAMSYLKLNEDSTIQFAVVCSGNGPRGTPMDGSTNLDRPKNLLCTMKGYFEGWPFQALVPYSHRNDWANAFGRIQAFLTKISTENTGPGETQ